jgi:hypothetical protein
VELSVSDSIPNTAIEKALSREQTALYALRARRPSPTLVRASEDVRDFGLKFQDLMGLIRTHHGESCSIHLFPAIPASLAVQIGRVLLPKVHPPVLVYDYDTKRRGFAHALTL